MSKRSHELPLLIPVDPQAAYRDALDMIHTGQGHPLATIDHALRADPNFASGYCLRAALLVMSCREDAQEELARTLAAAAEIPADLFDEREHRHLAAANAWLARHLRRALQMYGDIAADYPHDTLALRVAHFGDLQWSWTQQLSDRVAQVLVHWHPGMHGYGHVLGMHAFGLAESGELALAEATGQRALAFDGRNAGAIHAIAHVKEMQGRGAEGIEWLRETAPVWTRSPAYSVHLWWHLALFHLDLGDLQDVLRIYDYHLVPSAASTVADLVDASALLWRLQLSGVDVAWRWQGLADQWSWRSLCGLRPFIDTHAMLAFVAADREISARRLLESLRACAARSPDLEPIICKAAIPICEAAMAFGAGRYADACTILQRLRHLSYRCGGSLAQCDLLHLTSLEAAMRSGNLELAHAVLSERMIRRPLSRHNHVLRGRVSALSLPRIGRSDNPKGVERVHASYTAKQPVSHSTFAQYRRALV
ncbi:MAG TPA: tetratricopeptide repeat protein [Burkholderiales bacterium]|nr:tetratricopeptide repeat protein [Burkholderiales bacterium]